VNTIEVTIGNRTYVTDDNGRFTLKETGDE